MKYSALSLAFISSALGATVPASASTWTTLTPTAMVSGGATNYDGTFGIAVVPITSSVSIVSAAKRDAISQIGDGQIQASTATPTTTAQAISQIGDGQIQASTSTATPTTVQAISQIGDGQIQASTSTAEPTTVQAISQIGDGQIQASTATATPTTVQAISQIGDGQIQASTSTATPTTTVGPISQISDGQIQATTGTTITPASQISDGQIQATTGTTITPASQISDGQAQATATASSSDSSSSASSDVVACKSDGTLELTLAGSILKDSKGRIGSIVANRQFQFDGPPPQAGAIYAAGWSIFDGNLAIGETVVFYQCLSGTFYNLYDESIGAQCKPVYLQVTDLVDC